LVPPLHLEIAEAQLGLAVGGSEIAGVLAAQLARCRRRALVTVPYVHAHVAAVGPLLDALGALCRRGVAVRLLLGAVPEARDAEVLRATGMAVRVMDPGRSTTGHAKGLVADGTVVLGSANWSSSGLGGNRECALALADDRAADWFAAALERDWEVSDPL
jgi:phosphatidylserine/phosphatidylglycerophosphate/cardiolipin synthase-like enzyme